MKNLLLLVCCVAFTFPLSAQKEEKTRSWSALTFSMIGEKIPKAENRIYTQKGLPKWGEYSLKGEDVKRLNEIEKQLLEQYSDLIITKYSHAYFLLDDKAIGLASKTGETLVEPVDGKVRISYGAGYTKQFYMFGEQTEDFDRWANIGQTQTNNSNYDIALPLGLFKAVAVWGGKVGTGDVKGVIPSGRYDFISLALRSGGFSKKNNGFYVYKKNETGELLCGYCDADGVEIIPCKYKSVYYDGSNFVGDNTKTMLEWNDYYNQKMKLKKEEAEQRQQTWATVMNGVGQTLGVVVEQMGGTVDVPSASVNSATHFGASGNYQSQYAHWERLAEKHYNSLTNLGSSVSTKDKKGKSSKRGKAGGVTQDGDGNYSVHLSGGNYTSMKKSLREAQSEMAKIRRKAASAGVKIEQSEWETVTVSY